MISSRCPSQKSLLSLTEKHIERGDEADVEKNETKRQKSKYT